MAAPFNVVVLSIACALFAFPPTVCSVNADEVAFPPDFEFGAAYAAEQVEDQLDGGWVWWAKQGNVAAFNNQPLPSERLRFWTNPDPDISLAAELGLDVFRLGISWERLTPEEPRNGVGVLNHTALRHYRTIVEKIRSRGMKIMLTLFHHAYPMWGFDTGGWTNASNVLHYTNMVSEVGTALGDLVDYWVTFNEPTAFVLFTYCKGMWPPGPAKGVASSLACISPLGDFKRAMGNIQEAHNQVYPILRERSSGAIGVAHVVGYSVPNSPLDEPAVLAYDALTKFPFIEAIRERVDFVGINYYSKEIVKGAGVAIRDDQEYSEAGRAVYPDGIYKILTEFNAHFHKERFAYWITENGIADSTDILRPSYIIEHLLGIAAAIEDGVDVRGYVHWTIGDNMEWADGYCPKFGLVGVDRASNLSRVKRVDSFELYALIAKQRKITREQRESRWAKVQEAAAAQTQRPFCRGADGVTSLDVPINRTVSKADWRFTAKPMLGVGGGGAGTPGESVAGLSGLL